MMNKYIDTMIVKGAGDDVIITTPPGKRDAFLKQLKRQFGLGQITSVDTATNQLTVEITMGAAGRVEICRHDNMPVYITLGAAKHVDGDNYHEHLLALEQPDDEDDEFMIHRVLGEKDDGSLWLIKNTCEGAITFLMSSEY